MLDTISYLFYLAQGEYFIHEVLPYWAFIFAGIIVVTIYTAISERR